MIWRPQKSRLEWIICTLRPPPSGGAAAFSWLDQAVGGAKEIVNTLGRRAAADLSESTGIGFVENRARLWRLFAVSLQSGARRLDPQDQGGCSYLGADALREQAAALERQIREEEIAPTEESEEFAAALQGTLDTLRRLL